MPQAEEVKHEYLSQDLATFELYGQVKSVTYTEEHVYPVTILFDEKGPGFKAPSSYTASNQTGNYTEET